MSVKRRPVRRAPERLRRANKICFYRIRREVNHSSEAVLILRPLSNPQGSQALAVKNPGVLGVLKGEG